jgi:hypothetical protein
LPYEKIVNTVDVKVLGDLIPIIDNAEVRKSPKNKPVLVTFEDTTVTFYGDSLWACNISVTAENVKLVSAPTAKATTVKSDTLTSLV